MKSQWDKIQQDKAKKTELQNKHKEYIEEIENIADQIAETIKRMSDARIGTPEDSEKISGLWGKYHAKKSMQTMASIGLNSLSLTGGLFMEKMFNSHNLICPDDKMQLIPHGFYYPIEPPRHENFDDDDEFLEAQDMYEEQIKNYKEFADGKQPEELVNIKGYFVCPECGKVYKLEHVGNNGRENSTVVKLYNAIKRELSR